MNITAGNEEYNFLIGYQDTDKYRVAFNKLAIKIFDLSFEEWYQAGYWNDKYILYTLFKGDRAVASASVNIMDFEVFGKQRRYIQIGTVMTDEAYRNRKLNRFLMENILKDWTQKSDLIYLYANKAVLNLYPKFGFDRVKEYEYYKPVDKVGSSILIEKLDMEAKTNKDMLYDYAKNTRAFGKISMLDGADMIMFHCTSFFENNVYYIKKLDIITVVALNKGNLHLLDIFGKQEVDLNLVIDTVGSIGGSGLIIGFTPMNCCSYASRKIVGDDILFVQSNKTKLFHDNKIMFPMLSRA